MKKSAREQRIHIGANIIATAMAAGFYLLAHQVIGLSSTLSAVIVISWLVMING